MPRRIQQSFTGGELAPKLHERHDLQKVQVGLATCRNFIVEAEGGVKNRPGTQYICEVKDSTKKVKLVPFEFNTEQTYMLEFGNQYIRVIKDGAQVLEPAVTITSTDNLNPVEVTTAAPHGYTTGDQVMITGVTTMTEINNRRFTITVTGASTFTLDGEDGTTYTDGTGGTVEKIYEISSPYLEADLPLLKYTQSADVLTLVHPSYAPRELSRTGDTSWSLAVISFVPGIGAPSGTAVVYGGGGTVDHEYAVTAVSDGGEESLPDVSDVGVNQAEATATAPHEVTWAPPVTGTVTIDSTANTNPVRCTATAHGLQSGERVYVFGFATMTEINTRLFYIDKIDNDTFDLRDEDGTTYTSDPAGGTAQPTPARKFNIYKRLRQSGLFGYIGTDLGTSPAGVNIGWKDTGIAPALTDTPPEARNPFDGINFPSTVSYFQQRLVFGRTDTQPQTVFMSGTGSFHNFAVSDPLKDDDAVTFTLASRQVNEIRHLMPLADLVILTAGGEWRVFGDQDQVITPTSIDVRPQTYHGSSDVIPIFVGGSVLYVQRQGNLVRDLTFALEFDRYQGNDLTVMAKHLFDMGKTITDWAYAKTPDSVVWGIRSDGQVIALTYILEHQVWGWHRHDTTNGTFENVAAVVEGTENAVYFVVKRTINAVTRRYIERLHTRDFATQDDAFFVDSGLTYDGTPETNFTNLHHLEGETLKVLADGAVVSPDPTVTSGAITLGSAASKVHAGLGIVADLETLDLEYRAAQGTAQGTRKQVAEVILSLLNSRGFQAGPDSSNLISNPLASLTTGEVHLVVSTFWTEGGRVFVRQDEPLPLYIRGIIMEMDSGD